MAKKKDKMRIIVNTNAMWAPSGYAQQACELLPRIRDLGYPLAIINFYGLEGGIFEKDGIKHYPKMHQQWGSDALVAHAQDFNADVTFTLQDIWVLQDDHLKQAKRWIPIVPIDHDPIPPTIKQKLRLAYRIVSYSKFGYEQLKKEGFNSTYIQHTVDTKIFKKTDRAKIRAKMNIPNDVFLFGMVAANKENPPRKCFQEVMDAFYNFQKSVPASAIYFHVMTDMKGGFPIKEYAKFLKIQDKMFTTSTYDQLYRVTKSDMADIYSMMDCLLMPSLNEGFGVPAIEAQACEVPVIVNDITAMPYLIKDGETGYKTKVAYKRFTNLLSYVGVPDVKDIEKKMFAVYEADRDKMGKAGRAFMKKEFDTNVVFKSKWQPFLSKLEKEVSRKT